MARYSHREIEEAKMLGRRLAASKNVSPPPLSRLRNATTLFFSILWLSIRMRSTRYWMLWHDLTTCPRCDGRGHRLVVEADYEGEAPCQLCASKGRIGWRERESWKWGQAAQRYRIGMGFSLAKAFYLCGLTPAQITKHEQGLVPLDDWPESLRYIAGFQLDREASGNATTT
jgi:hypothetical protein